MRKLIVVPAIVAAFILSSACTNVRPPPADSMQLAATRQTIKIYDEIPPNGTPIEQITATACDAPREVATDRLILLTSQRGGNAMTQLSCRDEGLSLACWSSATCTALALNVVEPPPPPVVRPKRSKPNVKKRVAN